jgi:hypothetical protein
MTYDIAPAPGNPRNSEGDTAFLTNGHLMLTWTRFTGPEDHACADIPAIFSTDRGTSWSEPRVLVSADEAQQNVMSVSLLREHSTGDLLLFNRARMAPVIFRCGSGDRVTKGRVGAHRRLFPLGQVTT